MLYLNSDNTFDENFYLILTLLIQRPNILVPVRVLDHAKLKITHFLIEKTDARTMTKVQASTTSTNVRFRSSLYPHNPV